MDSIWMRATTVPTVRTVSSAMACASTISWITMIIIVTLRPAIAIGMCLALYWIMSKATPWTLGILTGGRAKTNTTYA